MWKKVAIGGGLLMLVAPMVLFAAALGIVSAAACEAMDDIPFVECEFLLEGGLDGDQCGEVPVEVSGNIPDEWREIFAEAADKFHVNPNFLAAIYLTENGNTWRPLDSNWASSPAGATGPMQFMPGTWSDYGIDGDGDGTADISDPTDAVHTAASLFSASPHKGPPIYGSTSPDMATGSIGKPWLPGTLLYAAASYNAGPGTITKYTSADDGLDDPQWTRVWEVRRYLHNIHALLDSNLTKSGVTSENGYTGLSGGRTDHVGHYLREWSDPHGLGVGGTDGDDGEGGGSGDDCDVPDGDLNAVVEVARREFERGAREEPGCGFVCDEYIDDGDEAWCADFVSWVFREAGVPFKPTPMTRMYFWRHDWQIPAVIGMQRWFRLGSHGSEFFTPDQKDPRPGDVAIYTGHVNIVVAVDPSRDMLVTIGGNESDTVQQTSGTFSAGTSSGLVGYGRINAEPAD